jgi:flagellar protein FlbT
MPLKLSLKPGERFVLNGAVVENGDRRATLILQNKASVLREKDIMQEHEADTPAKRIYFPVMMMYLSSSSADGVYDQFVLRMTEFMGAISNPEILSECVTISKDVMGGEFYKALLRCRKLIAYEAERLAQASAGASKTDD